MDNEQVGEEVYISMINKAEKYCWFMTPYLISPADTARSIQSHAHYPAHIEALSLSYATFATAPAILRSCK